MSFLIEIKFIDGLSCPHIFCDVCDMPILRAGVAMAAWGERMQGPRQRSRIEPSFVHKGRCLQAFERGLPKGTTLMTDELNDFLKFLLHNCKANIR